MAFKRTSEGRVFFKSTEDENKPAAGNGNGGLPLIPEPSQNDQSQMQILVLLKSLNAKLMETQEERAVLKDELVKYRDELKKLEDKAKKHEQGYLDLEQKVAARQNETSKKASRVEETMKQTAKELEQARKLVEALEGKAQDSEEVIKTIREDLTQRKRMEEEMLNIQKAIEQQQKDQSEQMAENLTAFVALTKRMTETEARQEVIDNKIEEATTEFLKLDRKINKAIEDRTRMMRKLERIEESVQETREALNAKAMVLLTSQGRAAAADYAQITDGTLGPDHFLPGQLPEGEETKSFWSRHFNLDAPALAMIVVIGLLLGWMISEIKRPQQIVSDLTAPGEISWTGERALPPKEENLSEKVGEDKEAALSEMLESPDAPAPVAEIGTPETLSAPEAVAAELSEETSAADVAEPAEGAVSEQPAEVTPEAINEAIKTADDKTLMAAMEENPEAVAQGMNAIEPSSLSAEDLRETPPPAEDESAPAASDSSKSLRERMKPDSTLPEQIKAVETQAYDGVKEAQHDMGAIYIAGHESVKRDLNRAVFWFEQAANNGVANAKYNLGVLYHQGMGVKEDLSKALKLYSEAAEQGHPEAQYNLGIAYIGGIGYPYDPAKAADNFESAANKGVKEAAYNLGLIYENGLLGKPQPDEALMWYKDAAEKGSPEAKAALEQLAQSLGITLSEVNRIVDAVRATKDKKPASQESSIKDKAVTEPVALSPPKQGAVDSKFSGKQKIIAEIQAELMKRGLYPGPVDGEIGPVTTDAIRTYQTASSMDVVDGKPTQELLNYMKSSSVSD